MMIRIKRNVFVNTEFIEAITFEDDRVIIDMNGSKPFILDNTEEIRKILSVLTNNG